MSKRGPMPESVPFEQLVEGVVQHDEEAWAAFMRLFPEALQESIDRRD